ncbi:MULTISPECIES: hypothetical protein [unclassified Microcoleus]
MVQHLSWNGLASLVGLATDVIGSRKTSPLAVRVIDEGKARGYL